MPQSEVHIKVDRIQLPQTYPVRRAVLYPDAAHKIHIPNDEAGIHFGAFLDRNVLQEDSLIIQYTTVDPIAVISVFNEPLPEHLAPLTTNTNSFKSLRFRKFACLEQFQSRGIGSRIFEHVLDFARTDSSSEQNTIVWCDARWSTREWYMKRGMSVRGDRFFKGDIEYVVMAIEVGPTPGVRSEI